MTSQTAKVEPPEQKATFPDPQTGPPQQQETLAPAKGIHQYFALGVGTRVDRCSYILPNSLQCWKAGEHVVVETHPAQTGAKPTATLYQLCERHMKIQKAIDAGTLQPTNLNSTYKELTVYVPPSPLSDTPEIILTKQEQLILEENVSHGIVSIKTEMQEEKEKNKKSEKGGGS